MTAEVDEDVSSSKQKPLPSLNKGPASLLFWGKNLSLVQGKQNQGLVAFLTVMLPAFPIPSVLSAQYICVFPSQPTNKKDGKKPYLGDPVVRACHFPREVRARPGDLEDPVALESAASQE